MSEKNYDFRKFLDKVHQKDLRDPDLRPQADETEITPEWVVRIPEDASAFVRAAARDLTDYLFTSMDVGIRIGGNEPVQVSSIELKLDVSLPVTKVPMAPMSGSKKG